MSCLLLVVCCFVAVVQLVSPAAVNSEQQQQQQQQQLAARSAADVNAELKELRNRMKELEKKVEKLPRNDCPTDFIYVPSVNGCYKVLTRNLDWISAGLECRELHREAHLVIIDNAAEQHAIVNMMAHHHNDVSLRACAYPNSWGNHPMWTAGQRVNPAANTPFVWKVLSADGMKTTVSHMSYTSWHPNQPDFAGSVESCMHLYRGINFMWNDAPCNLQTCSLCEIDLA